MTTIRFGAFGDTVDELIANADAKTIELVGRDWQYRWERRLDIRARQFITGNIAFLEADVTLEVIEKDAPTCSHTALYPPDVRDRIADSLATLAKDGVTMRVDGRGDVVADWGYVAQRIIGELGTRGLVVMVAP